MIQEAQAGVYTLRDSAEIETAEALIQADLMTYNEETGEVVAEGNVRYENLVSGEKLEASRVEYNVQEQTGKFYEIRGEASPEYEPRPRLLTTSNPVVFEGEWAERIGDRYILHNGFLTNCKLPNPVWTLSGPTFDIIPGERALVHRSVFRVKKVPLLYVPVFYKSLKERPRKSGFLTPSVGNSSRRGTMAGAGYYWAINRSYDGMYRAQYYSQGDLVHHVNFRGKPTGASEFDVYVYGANDAPSGAAGAADIDASGYLLIAKGEAELGKGFQARAEINVLSSFLFRREFTESFNEAVFNEVHSVGYISRNWSSYGLTALFRQVENFKSTDVGDVITIRRLPSLNFTVRNKPVNEKVLPVWVSLESTAGFMRRSQPDFETRRFVERLDVTPRVMTTVNLKGIRLSPSVSVRGTHYDSSWKGGQISGDGILRTSGELTLDIALPSLARVYDGPGWLGERVKHVIETTADFRHVQGVDRFDRYIRFDETELVASTTEADLDVTNRLYAKNGGVVREVFSWELRQRYYFDPDFGGAVLEGQRNVLLSTLDLTGFAFLDSERRYSPIISHFRLSPIPGIGMGWRADFDPVRHRFVNSGLTADARMGSVFISLGHNQVRSSRVLAPNTNQFRGMIAVGDQNRRGWNAGFSAIYDFREDYMQFATTQVAYNTDCCGVSFQYRRLGFRGENEFRAAFTIANFGSFGTLRRQEQLF